MAALEKLTETLAPLPEAMAVVGAGVARIEARLGSLELEILQLRTDLDVRTTAILEVVESGSQASQHLFDEVLRTVRGSDEETRRQMRVLHEDLVERIGRLGEQRR